jgi:ABC-type sugar transport system ATPase subunit
VPDALTGLRGVTKRFGSITALDDVTIDIAGGTVHALVGENGAGKSTVVNILSGVIQPDAGSVTLEGVPTMFITPSAAMRAGVSTIYQERAIVSKLTVGENIVLGHEQTRFGLIQRRRSDAVARDYLSRVQLRVEPRRPMALLAPAEQQLVAIAKALSHDVRVLILDEPTAALTGEEAEKLFSLLVGLREHGIAVLYITHRMREVERLADAVTVLKDGKLVRTIEAAGVTEEEILPLMVGREIDRLFPSLEPPRDEIVVEACDLEVPGELRGVSLAVRAGEIVGIAGLEGSGKSALARVLAGSEVAAVGWVEVRGKRLKGRGVVEALASGVGYIPPDRRAQAIVRTFSIRASTTLSALRRVSRLGFVRRRLERGLAEGMRERLDIKTPSIEAPIWTLSGGNQQKVVLGRALAAEASVLVCDEPTAGVDVGARVEIYRFLAEVAARGSAIVLVSSDVLELIGMCHRVVVLREGRAVADFPQGSASEEDLVRAQLPRQHEEVIVGPTA